MTRAVDPGLSRIAALRETVAALHAELHRATAWSCWTAGNVSARVPGEDLIVIKPSGVTYDDLTADSMIVCDLDGEVVEGDSLAVQRHRRARLRLPARCPRSAGRAHPLHVRHAPGRRAASRSRACSPRWPTSSAARSRSGRSR